MNLKDVQIRAIRTGNLWNLEVTMRQGGKRVAFVGNQTSWTNATYASFDGALEAGIILARFENSGEQGITSADLDERIFHALHGSRLAKPSDWNTDGDVRSDNLTGRAG